MVWNVNEYIGEEGGGIRREKKKGDRKYSDINEPVREVGNEIREGDGAINACFKISKQ